MGATDADLELALRWVRRDGKSRELADGRWARHPIDRDRTVSFSLDTEVTLLEEGFWKVTRYGVEGRIGEFPWGYEVGRWGGLPENERRYVGGLRWDYAVWSITYAGLEGIPAHHRAIVRSHWGSKEDCALGGPPSGGHCKRQDPRFLVEVAGAGRIVVCARHVTGWLLDSAADGTPVMQGVRDLAHQAAARAGRGAWTEWQDRAAELTWDLVAPAVDRGQPLPDIAHALLAEADRVRASRSRNGPATAIGQDVLQTDGEQAVDALVRGGASGLDQRTGAAESLVTARHSPATAHAPPTMPARRPDHEGAYRYQAVRTKSQQHWVVVDTQDHTIAWALTPTGGQECYFTGEGAEKTARKTAHRLNTDPAARSELPPETAPRYTRPPQGEYLGAVGESITATARILQRGTSAAERGKRTHRKAGKKAKIARERPFIAMTTKGNLLHFWHEEGTPRPKPGGDFYVSGVILKTKLDKNQKTTVLASVTLDPLDRVHLYQAAPDRTWSLATGPAPELTAGLRVRLRDPDSPYDREAGRAAFATAIVRGQRTDGRWRADTVDGRTLIITRRDVHAIQAGTDQHDMPPAPAAPHNSQDVPEILRRDLLKLRYPDLRDRWETHLAPGDEILLITEPYQWQKIAEAKDYVFRLKDGRPYSYHQVIARRRDGHVTAVLEMPKRTVSQDEASGHPKPPPIGGPIRDIHDLAALREELAALDAWSAAAGDRAQDETIAGQLLRVDDRRAALARAVENRQHTAPSARLPPVVDQRFITPHELIGHLRQATARPHALDRAAEDKQASYCRVLARRADAEHVVIPAAHGQLAVVQVTSGDWQVRLPHRLFGLGKAVRVASRRHAQALAEAMVTITDAHGAPFPWTDPWADLRVRDFRDAHGRTLNEALQRLRAEVGEPPEPTEPAQPEAMPATPPALEPPPAPGDHSSAPHTLPDDAATARPAQSSNEEPAEPSAPRDPGPADPGWTTPQATLPLLAAGETRAHPQAGAQPTSKIPQRATDDGPEGRRTPHADREPLASPGPSAHPTAVDDAREAPDLQRDARPQPERAREPTPEASNAPTAPTGDTAAAHPASPQRVKHLRVTAVARSCYADTELRPTRLIHADGTPLIVHPPTAEGDAVHATAHGAAAPDWGPGQWQAVRYTDGSVAAVHPALISQPDQPRYPGTDGGDRARWEALDRAEARGAPHAQLPPGHVVVGDRLILQQRSSRGPKQHLGSYEITAIRDVTRGSSKQPREGREFRYRGPRGGNNRAFHETSTDVDIAHPDRHPAVLAPVDGRPVTTRLLVQHYLQGPHRHTITDISTLELVGAGQFAAHRDSTGWHLLPATTAQDIRPAEHLGLEPHPLPLAGLPDAQQAAAFAEQLVTRFAAHPAHGVDFASPDLAARAGAWRDADGGPLYLALLAERAAFDRAHGRADSPCAQAHAHFETAPERPTPPPGRQWADRLAIGDSLLVEIDGVLTPSQLHGHHVGANGLATLTLDGDRRIYLPRNALTQSDTAQPLAAADATLYADRRASWAVTDGWLEFRFEDLDPAITAQFTLPLPLPDGACVRGLLNGRDDDAGTLMLTHLRLLTPDGQRHRLAEHLTLATPDTLTVLRTQQATTESTWTPRPAPVTPPSPQPEPPAHSTGSRPPARPVAPTEPDTGRDKERNRRPVDPAARTRQQLPPKTSAGSQRPAPPRPNPIRDEAEHVSATPRSLPPAPSTSAPSPDHAPLPDDQQAPPHPGGPAPASADDGQPTRLAPDADPGNHADPAPSSAADATGPQQHTSRPAPAAAAPHRRAPADSALLHLPDGRSYHHLEKAARQLTEDFRAALDAPHPPQDFTLYGHLAGRPLYLYVRIRTPHEHDAGAQGDTRVLYFGLKKDSAGPCFASLTAAELTGLPATGILTALQEWSVRRKPGLTDLHTLIPPTTEATHRPPAASPSTPDSPQEHASPPQPQTPPHHDPPPARTPQPQHAAAPTGPAPTQPAPPTPLPATPAPEPAPGTARTDDPEGALSVPPSARLLTLAQQAASAAGLAPDLLGVHEDSHRLIITHATTGNSDLDAEVARQIRSSLNTHLSQRHDRELARYAVDIRVTQAPGQATLAAPPGSAADEAPLQHADERLYMLLEEAAALFTADLSADTHEARSAAAYLAGQRHHDVQGPLTQRWRVGHARRSRNASVADRLRKRGYNDAELVRTGILRQDENSGALNNAFFHRLVWPARDLKGRVIGFVGRTLGDPKNYKYLNTATDTPAGPSLYKKSHVLLGMERLPATQGPHLPGRGPF
ncbi:hypothetical protein [Streptomyces spectabilis]|uniref:DNA primase DNAG catalytic core N-terminal domain-containing protein n=1 Tax=Streptomyces spectabilis TaxID=68270 RepID=A0A7W8B2B7_STRST|nr:hypothetical protein [Streptomyces spectabilis]MBB5109006.1 hypothetical protein [Streptomyces spectabilis]